MTERFTTILWGRPEEASRQVWVERVLDLMRAISEETGATRFVAMSDDETEYEVPVDGAAIEAEIDRNVNCEGGQVFHELGSIFALGFGDADHDLGTATIGVETTTASARNAVIVDYGDSTCAGRPEVARAVLERAVPVWSPDWGCVEGAANAEARDDERSADILRMDSMLHWVTYFGPQRTGTLNLDAAGALDFVDLRHLHDGVEIVLGDQWPGDDSLLRLQHETEALILRPTGRLGRARRRLGL